MNQEHEQPIEEVEALRLLVEQCRHVVVTQGQDAFRAINATEARRQADRLDLLAKAEGSLNEFEAALRAFPEIFQEVAEEATDVPTSLRREVRNASIIAQENLGQPVSIEKEFAVAKGHWDGSRFVIAPGSEMRIDEVPSIHAWIRRHRRTFIDGGIVERKGRAYVFLEPAVLPSLSAAAGVILGRAANGPQEWKLPNGEPIGDLNPI